MVKERDPAKETEMDLPETMRKNQESAASQKSKEHSVFRIK